MHVKSKSTDFTRGSIIPLLITFSLPILIGQLFQNLYNSVDSIVVGQYVGTTALAAVSTSADVSFMIVGFFTGLSAGAGVLFSRFFGARDWKNLHDSIHTAIAFSAVFGTIISIAGYFLTPTLLRIVACPEDVYPDAILYLRIYCIGAVFTSIYNVGSGVLRAVGDSIDPLIYLIVSSVANILLDLLFVLAFKMGVAGVAIATVLSQILSVGLVMHTMLKTDDVFKLTVRDLRIDGKLLLQILDLGLPAAIQTCLISISNLFVQRYINMLGKEAMAGMGAAKKVDKFVGMISNSVAIGATTFVSQNVGANQYDRAFKGIRSCFVICSIAIAVIGTPTYFFAGTILQLFTKNDQEALSYGIRMIHVMMPLYYFQMCNNIFANTVRGFGRSRAVMVLSLLGMVGMRQLFLNIFMHLSPSAEIVYYAYPVGWFFAALFVFIYYLKTIKHVHKQAPTECEMPDEEYQPLE